MNALRHKHSGETCWIVGKGPSLRYLRAEHFGAGPVIALNDALALVQNLGLDNRIYSLQQDGVPQHMVEPRADVWLILQDTAGYSRDWFPNHPIRILVDPIKDLGFDHIQVLAVRMAIAIAKQMECSFVKMLCCDSLTTGALETFDPRTGICEVTGAARWYLATKPYIFDDLQAIQHEFILPKEAGSLARYGDVAE